jgi:hypothetical protein
LGIALLRIRLLGISLLGIGLLGISLRGIRLLGIRLRLGLLRPRGEARDDCEAEGERGETYGQHAPARGEGGGHGRRG